MKKMAVILLVIVGAGFVLITPKQKKMLTQMVVGKKNVDSKKDEPSNTEKDSEPKSLEPLPESGLADSDELLDDIDPFDDPSLGAGFEEPLGSGQGEEQYSDEGFDPAATDPDAMNIESPDSGDSFARGETIDKDEMMKAEMANGESPLSLKELKKEYARKDIKKLLDSSISIVGESRKYIGVLSGDKSGVIYLNNGQQMKFRMRINTRGDKLLNSSCFSILDEMGKVVSGTLDDNNLKIKALPTSNSYLITLMDKYHFVLLGEETKDSRKINDYENIAMWLYKEMDYGKIRKFGSLSHKTHIDPALTLKGSDFCKKSY